MKKNTPSARLRHASAARFQRDPFPALLRSFFQEWLAEQRNASIHTIRSYRDTWRLFLRFLAERKHCEVAQIKLADLTASEVSELVPANRTMS